MVAKTVKSLPAVQDPCSAGSLGQEDPLEKEMATHSSILAWRIPGTEEPGGLPSMGSHSRICISAKIPGVADRLPVGAPHPLEPLSRTSSSHFS